MNVTFSSFNNFDLFCYIPVLLFFAVQDSLLEKLPLDQSSSPAPPATTAEQNVEHNHCLHKFRLEIKMKHRIGNQWGPEKQLLTGSFD